MFEIVGIQGTFMEKSEKTLRKLLFLSLLTDTTFLSFLPKPPHRFFIAKNGRTIDQNGGMWKFDASKIYHLQTQFLKIFLISLF